MDFEAEIKQISERTKRLVEELGLPAEQPVRRAPARDMTPARTGCTVGALLRRQVRRELMSLEDEGVTFREEKGLLDSNFYIRGPRWAINNVNAALTDWFERLNS